MVKITVGAYLRFLLSALPSAWTHKPQCIGSQTQTKRITFAVSRDLESRNTWAMQPERTATPNSLFSALLKESEKNKFFLLTQQFFVPCR